MAPVAAKAPKEAKPKKATTAAPKKPRAYPSYYEMINEAITALKERTGSSQIAIAKFIEEKQKANLPTNFKKLLLVQLRKLVANGKLVKVKNSFKLPPKSPATTVTKKSKTPSTKAVAQKPKSSTTTTAAKKTKSASAKDGSKKPKPASTTVAKKRKAADAGVAAKKAKTEGKKVVAATKVKKPKTIKSPAKKVAAKKGKK